MHADDLGCGCHVLAEVKVAIIKPPANERQITAKN
jgi:hypothetical protein